MTWEPVELRERSLKHRDSENPRRHRLTCTLARIGYENEAGEMTPVDMTPQRVTSAAFDGWRVTDAPWRYLLGQPDGEADGWVVAGFRGGGQNWHNFGFRALGALYYEHTTGNTQRIGGEPDYDRANLAHTPQAVTLGPNDDVINVAALAEWADVWPGVDLRFLVDGYRLKEDVVVSQATREAIPPPGDFGMVAANTWFAVLFRIDWTDVPKVVRDSVEIDRDGVFLDDGAPIELRNALDDLLAFMPISEVYVEAGDGERESVPLTKRFYRDTDGQHYLIMGAPVPDIAALPAGALVFDPTVQESVGAEVDDGDQIENGSGLTSNYASVRNKPHVSASARIHSLTRFDGITIDAGSTINTASVTVKPHSTSLDSVDCDIYGEDTGDSNNLSDEADIVNRDLTSASVAWVDDDLGTSPVASPDIASIITEIIANAGWSSGNALSIIYWARSSGDQFWFKSYESGDTAATLDIDYTAGGTEHALSGTAAVAVAASGDVAVAKSLAGTADATVGASASLNRAVALSGTAAVSIGASGGLSVAKPIAGQADITTAATGTLGVNKSLAGSTEIAVGATADLKRAVELTGTGPLAVGATAALTNAKSLAGEAPIVWDGSGALARAVELAGQSDVVWDGAGALAVARALAGQADIEIDALADLVRAVALGGTIPIAWGGSGALTVVGQVALAGTAPLALSGAGALTRAVALSGAAPVVWGGTGALGRAVALGGTVAIVWDGSGDLGTGVVATGLVHIVTTFLAPSIEAELLQPTVTATLLAPSVEAQLLNTEDD